MAIGATIYKMGIDTSQFAAGSALTRAELRMTKQILKETATETEKYGAAVSRLDNLVQKGAITHKQQNQILGQVRQEQLRGIPVIGNYVSGLYAMGPAGAAAAVATAGFATAVANVMDQMSKIDDLINTSQNLGIAAGHFQKLAGAADFADISMSGFASGMQTMEVQVAKAAEGIKKAKIGFDLLGLDAKKLIELRPEQAFLQIVDALGTLDNAFIRARTASAIFGSQDFARIDTGDIERATKNIEAMGGVITKEGVDKFNELDNSIKDVSQSWDALWKKITVQSAPIATPVTSLIGFALRNIDPQDLIEDLIMTGYYPGVGAFAESATDIAASMFNMNRHQGTPEEDKGGAAIKDIVDEQTKEEIQAADSVQHYKQQKAMLALDELNKRREKITEEEFKQREELQKKEDESRAAFEKFLMRDRAATVSEAWRMEQLAKKEAQAEMDAREIVADMEKDLANRTPTPTTEVLRLGSRGAIEAVARANRAPQIVSAPEMTKAQREAVELLRKIEAKEPIMVVEESL